MVECWKYDPRDRPDFVQILGKLISDPSIDGNFLKVSVLIIIITYYLSLLLITLLLIFAFI